MCQNVCRLCGTRSQNEPHGSRVPQTDRIGAGHTRRRARSVRSSKRVGDSRSSWRRHCRRHESRNDTGRAITRQRYTCYPMITMINAILLSSLYHDDDDDHHYGCGGIVVRLRYDGQWSLIMLSHACSV